MNYNLFWPAAQNYVCGQTGSVVVYGHIFFKGIILEILLGGVKVLKVGIIGIISPHMSSGEEGIEPYYSEAACKKKDRKWTQINFDGETPFIIMVVPSALFKQWPIANVGYIPFISE